MCRAGSQAPGDVSEALRMARSSLDLLNSPAADDLQTAAVGEVLAALGALRAKLTAAQVALLRRFDAASGHDADGYGTSSAWLAARAQMTPAAAKILVDAAAAGACLDDLAAIVACALERWRSQHPDADEGGFEDRHVQVGTTFGGAGVIRGDLTPECAAAVQAVLEALGKRHGPEDTRSEGQRFHDALQLGCELLIRARMVPDRAGADTQVVTHIPLSRLREMPGGSELEQAWISAGLGEPGYLTGPGAEAVACDALTVPVVTGHAPRACRWTSATCVLLCQFHHDVCVHRWGWRIILHPDGTTSAYGPAGQILHSHSPPTARAA